MPKAGQFYTLKGLANYDANETDPVVTMPNYATLDSVSARFIGSETLDGINHDVYSFSTRIIGGVTSKESFFHIIPIADGLSNEKYVFEKEHSAFKPMKHTNGFLIDYSRTKNGLITWVMKVPGGKRLSTIKVNIANVDKTYYYYNNYRTDILTGVNSSYVSPVIIGDGLNVITSKAYASYSGQTVNSYNATIR